MRMVAEEDSDGHLGIAWLVLYDRPLLLRDQISVIQDIMMMVLRMCCSMKRYKACLLIGSFSNVVEIGPLGAITMMPILPTLSRSHQTHTRWAGWGWIFEQRQPLAYSIRSLMHLRLLRSVFKHVSKGCYGRMLRARTNDQLLS